MTVYIYLRIIYHQLFNLPPIYSSFILFTYHQPFTAYIVSSTDETTAYILFIYYLFMYHLSPAIYHLYILHLLFIYVSL